MKSVELLFKCVLEIEGVTRIQTGATHTTTEKDHARFVYEPT